MLQARLTSTKITDEEIEHKYVNDISITPLAIPMLCGPGAITNSIVLWEDSHSIGMKIAMLISILIMAILTYIVLWSASKIINFLGETGTKILTRLMGLIVMVIAVEFFFSGLIPFLQKI
jgi:multiple antibiotic resistance protein